MKYLETNSLNKKNKKGENIKDFRKPTSIKFLDKIKKKTTI